SARMRLVCGGMIFYARRTTERRVTYLLNTATRHAQEEFIELPTAADVIREMNDDLKADRMAMLLVDSQGHVRVQSQRRIPTWPHQPKDGWWVVTVPAGADTLVIGYPWAQTEEVLRR